MNEVLGFMEKWTEKASQTVKQVMLTKMQELDIKSNLVARACGVTDQTVSQWLLAAPDRNTPMFLFEITRTNNIGKLLDDGIVTPAEGELLKRLAVELLRYYAEDLEYQMLAFSDCEAVGMETSEGVLRAVQLLGDIERARKGKRPADKKELRSLTEQLWTVTERMMVGAR